MLLAEDYTLYSEGDICSDTPRSTIELYDLAFSELYQSTSKRATFWFHLEMVSLEFFWRWMKFAPFRDV